MHNYQDHIEVYIFMKNIYKCKHKDTDMGQEDFSFIDNKIGSHNLNLVDATPRTLPGFLYFDSKYVIPNILSSQSTCQYRVKGWIV